MEKELLGCGIQGGSCGAWGSNYSMGKTLEIKEAVLDVKVEVAET